MPATYTPLRYPGGKAKLGPFLASLLNINKLVDCVYAEPYAGGAGAALFLLFRGYASRIHLNDIDAAVTSFWRAILEQNDKFVSRIEATPLTVEEWDRQKENYMSATGFELGFAFFYLNRTNRSGIMNGGIIGGRSQEGVWRMDARFNRADLVERIRSIGRMKRLISVSGMDALDFVDDFKPVKARKALVYLDPPYFSKGQGLYTNFYKANDHASIAKRLKTYSLPWLLTYDDCAEIREIYKGFQILESELSYSAREVRRGRELVILSRTLRLPQSTPSHQRRPAGFCLVQEDPA
jgi:DNA adenine methylase